MVTPRSDEFSYWRWLWTGNDGLGHDDAGEDELTEDELEEARDRQDHDELLKEAHRPP